jgi:cytochrome b561
MPRRYPPVLVVLHWLAAFLVVGALLGGTFNMADVPNTDPGKVATLRMHMIVGGLILVAMLVRLVVRARKAVPAPVAGPGWQVAAARAVHLGLYVVTIGMAASGVALAVASGLPGMVFGSAPLPESFQLFAPRMVHGVLATVLGVLVGVHVLAAFWHAGVKGDGIMARMWFGR